MKQPGVGRNAARYAGVDELMTAIAEQARSDVVAEGMPRDWVCTTSASDEEDGVPIQDPAIPPCVRTSCPERRPHHHVAVCGRQLLTELAAALRPVIMDPRTQGEQQHQEDPMGKLLEIVSR